MTEKTYTLAEVRRYMDMFAQASVAVSRTVYCLSQSQKRKRDDTSIREERSLNPVEISEGFRCAASYLRMYVEIVPKELRERDAFGVRELDPIYCRPESLAELFEQVRDEFEKRELPNCYSLRKTTRKSKEGKIK